MVAEIIKEIGRHVALLDGVLHAVDYHEIRSAHDEVLKMAESDTHRISGVADAAVRTLDSIACCGAYDSDTSKYLNNLAEKFHGLGVRARG